MVGYLLALKPSDSTSVLQPFFESLHSGDRLCILSVLEDMDDELFPHEMNNPWKQFLCRKEEQRLKELVNHLKPQVKCCFCVEISNHFGESICKEVEAHDVDFLVFCLLKNPLLNFLRHKFKKDSTDQRLGLDSTVAYCLERVKCDVIMLKVDHLSFQKSKAIQVIAPNSKLAK